MSTTRKRLRTFDRSAVSEVMGEILLLVVFVILGGVAVAAVVHTQPPIQTHHGEVDALALCGQGGWGTGDETVVLTHIGGEPFEANQTAITFVVDGQGQPSRIESGLAPFKIGDTWPMAARSLTPASDVRYAVAHTNGDGSSNIADEGRVTTFSCPVPASPGSAFVHGFGLLPFLDPNCDFEFQNGTDELVPLADLSDGAYATPAGVCLVLPRGLGDLAAPEVQFSSPGGGILLGANLTATSGMILLEAPHGKITVLPGVRLHADRSIQVTAGADVLLNGVSVVSDRGVVSIDTGGGLLAGDALRITAGAPAAPVSPVPNVDLPQQAGQGSVRVCVLIMDRLNHVTRGWTFASDETFNEPGVHAPAHHPLGYGDSGVLPLTAFHSPLALNADLLFSDGIADAECVNYNDLEVDHWWYGQEVRGHAAGWFAPKYNDGLDAPVDVLTDFRPYSGELFTPSLLDDASRDMNADGDISLSMARLTRTVVVLNQFDDVRAPAVSLQSAGGDIQLTDALVIGLDSDVRIDSGGGRIAAARIMAESRGDEGQVQFISGGAAIDVSFGTLTSQTGRVLLDSGTGPMTAMSTTVTAKQNVDAVGGSFIDVTNAQLRSTNADLTLNVLAASRHVAVGGASFRDRNNKADTQPNGAIADGTPAFGGTE